ncbi:hypothetical protein E7681_02860 [Thalassobius vesicularis]|uniref:Type II secretion system protein M n=1 Tax=Thalassobius vesicularis TaxID=1294297 RepID=A0A4S3MES2_9RHOB|nr:type II secretion system protein GspM [Thalassobius vesicularis]THD76796.1 hypothetical protein E7681_02860 [Thalassobius vesicularis]
MSARLIDLLLPLSARERLLLGLAVLVILPLAVVFGVLLPLMQARQEAVAAQSDAVALNVWVQDRIAEKTVLERLPVQTIGAPVGSTAIEQGLIDARLRQDVSALGAQSGGVIELRFDRVDFVRLANWLSVQHPGWGYTIDSYRFEAIDEPGKVAASILLSPRS